jgi:hypothetical protein
MKNDDESTFDNEDFADVENLDGLEADIDAFSAAVDNTRANLDRYWALRELQNKAEVALESGEPEAVELLETVLEDLRKLAETSA